MTLIAPPILSADFARMGAEVEAVDDAGADWIHVDVMDGHFVSQITFGPAMVQAIRPHTQRPLDVHLMVSPVEPHLEAFAAAGADSMTLHVEADPHVHRSVQRIRELGLRVGVSLNPGTSLDAVDAVLNDVDLVLVMSVNPGFGGQRFIPHAVPRVRRLREMIGRRPVLIQVDGGVRPRVQPQLLRYARHGVSRTLPTWRSVTVVGVRLDTGCAAAQCGAHRLGDRRRVLGESQKVPRASAGQPP